MNHFPDFSGKKRVIFLDDVDIDFAQKYGKIYPNAIFFTNNNEIWKNGVGIANYITVDSNSNTISVDGKNYNLVINNGVLSFSTTPKWYWYVGYNINNSVPNLTSELIIDNNNNSSPGWRIITEDNEILTNINTIHTNNIYVNSTEIENGKLVFNNNNNPPLYSYLYTGNINNKIKINSYNTPINFGKVKYYRDLKNIVVIDLILPEILVNNFNLGLYDDLGNTNFLNNIPESNSQINIETNPGIYYIKPRLLQYYGQNYLWYKIQIVTKSAISNDSEIGFNLHLYRKN